MTSTPDQTPAHSAIAKPRRRIWRRLWAFLLSLVIPGLGQAYNREYKRGVVVGVTVAVGLLFALSFVKLSALVWRAPPMLTYGVIVAGVIASLGLVIWAAIAAFRHANLGGRPTFGWKLRYLIYLGFILGWQLPNTLAHLIPGLRPVRAASESMLPTLELGDNFFVVDGYYHRNEPERGELAIFKFPCDYSRLDPTAASLYRARCDPSTDWIKRIIGLPGDRLQMRNGILYINDEAVKRKRVEDYSYSGFEHARGTQFAQYDESMPGGIHYRIIKLFHEDQPLDNTPVFIVPAGRYFVLGDNRDNSVDSRDPYGGVGYVPADHLVGPATFVFFSLDHGQRVDAARQWLPVIRWERLGLALD
jgi:signal peptidase I